ncbi:Prolyl-tRNA synthetase, bacterial type [Thermogutta terrifontis]|uniref:Proline--tRNA ligase n=1 Tax=Thermogutta terrifontis TaxID=1331910 RepID=A0A286RGH0_9BACT|nr:proline--tRNA ligase [Thermogutta terrifontis]ASV75051.1 Prolyl-tRNA synthetase, bacterial type [Thermogutta terrifontis]
MLWSKTFIPTLKEIPEGAEIPSHVLMLRAGLINQVMAGAYTYLPLGLRALRKAERIVREEMDAAGAVELLMPSLSPLSLWERTGRDKAFGDVLIRVELKRQNRKVNSVLGPTHEEIVTDLVAHHISSYRQLPITLYQISPKFRNEERPRFGVLRTSEFLMKDAYSFDTSLEGLNRSYEAMYRAYCRIFDRCCLAYIPVEAESGPIGGEASHEFMVPANNGEDKIVHCAACGYAANLERAEIGPRRPEQPAVTEPAPLERVPTPGASSIDQVSRFLNCRPEDLIKTLIYLADGQPVAVLIRGDHEANENKIRRALRAKEIQLADPATIERVTGAPVGFAGPVGLKEKLTIIADYDIQFMRNAITGANEADTHLKGVNLGRDFNVERFADLRCAQDNDPCPRCSGILRLRPAIEVGHVFKLGTKYSEALSARFLDPSEQLKPIIMGCYGIGINRILAALIETTHDENGIIWPVALAPYEVVIVPVNVADEKSREAAFQLYNAFQKENIEVILDDRDVRAGVKFKDVDLIGFPMRVVVGERGLAQGNVEVKWRWEKAPQLMPLDKVVAEVSAWIREERETGARFKAALYGSNG